MTPTIKGPDEDDLSSRNNQKQTEGMTGPSESYSSLWHAMGSIFHLAVSIMLSEFFQNTLPVTDLAFVGRLLSKSDLAATALATVWFNLWNAALLGFSTALDTLLSQAHGAKEPHLQGAWTGNGGLVIMLVTCVVAALMALCGPAMVLLGQEENVAQRAGTFSYRLIPGLFPYYAFKVLMKHLQTQDIVWPGVMIGIVANIFNIGANWWLIRAWGLNGAPVATTLTRFLELFAIILYFLWNRDKSWLKDSWPTLAPRTFLLQKVNPKRESRRLQQSADATSLGNTEQADSKVDLEDASYTDSSTLETPLAIFLRLAIAGSLSFMAEAWSFEITTILAGLLGTIELDAHIITLSIATFLYLSFPFSIGVAASIATGQLVGAGYGRKARQSANGALVWTGLVQLLLILLVWPSSKLLGNLFSSDAQVADLSSKLLPISCIFMMGDSIQTTTGGVLRGLGRQKLVLGLNIMGFWILAVPLGAILTFVADIGVFGLWWGMTVGIYSSAALGLIVLYFNIDWCKETEMATERSCASRNAKTTTFSES